MFFRGKISTLFGVLVVCIVGYSVYIDPNAFLNEDSNEERRLLAIEPELLPQWINGDFDLEYELLDEDLAKFKLDFDGADLLSMYLKPKFGARIIVAGQISEFQVFAGGPNAESRAEYTVTSPEYDARSSTISMNLRPRSPHPSTVGHDMTLKVEDAELGGNYTFIFEFGTNSVTLYATKEE